MTLAWQITVFSIIKQNLRSSFPKPAAN